MKKEYKLGIIGAGNMANAIVNGILKSNLLNSRDMIISDLDDIKLKVFSELGLSTTKDNKYIAENCSAIMFAVKPQVSSLILEDIANIYSADYIISIMAGVSIAKIQNYIKDACVVRVMPNTPSLIGLGMSALSFSKGFQCDFATKIFASIGKVTHLDESLFDAVTSLSGSGPAYVYLFIKALIDGGIEGGLDYETAKILAIQTVTGASKMIEQSSAPIDQLIDAVCSKGGTTIQAITSFKENNLEEIVKIGITKCRDRSKELSNE